jgi:hypothetical protein
MLFTPPRQPGLAIGFVAGGVLFLLALGFALGAQTMPLSFFTFLLGCLAFACVSGAVFVAYRTWALLSARYILSPTDLTVEWGDRRVTWPLPHITEVRAGSNEIALKPAALHWPGNLVGHAQATHFGQVEFLAATEPNGYVLVHGPEGWLALSPGNVAAFLAAFGQMQTEAAALAAHNDLAETAPISVPPLLQRWSFGRDRLAVALVVFGGVSLLALLGYLLALYPQLPPVIALHFNAGLAPDRFGPPSGLFILPTLAGLAWIVNTLGGLWLHRRPDDRAGAYLLFAATLFIHALAWVATFGLLTAGA